jgi:surface antigen
MIAVAGLSLALVACQASAPPGQIGVNNTTGGTLIGAGLGGLLGNQFGGGSGKAFTTLAGVLVGGLVGSQVGKSMDEADVAYANRSQQNALNNGVSGQPVAWHNPDNGHQGTIVPQPAYQSNGTYCREFTQTISVGGQTQDGYGTACRQPDGSWKIVQ